MVLPRRHLHHVALATLVAGCDGGATYLPCSVPASFGAPRADLPPPVVGPCDAQGWCWENPLPFRDSLGPIFHRRDVTVVTSARGHVLRLVDGTWEALPALPKPPGYSGHTNPSDVFAVDEIVYVAGQIGIDGVAWRFDGVSWQTFPFGRDFGPGAIAGTGRDDLRIVGRGGAKRWTGRTFEDVATPRSVGQAAYGCRGEYVGGFFQGSFVDEELVFARGTSDFVKAAEVPLVNVQVTAVHGTTLDDVFIAGFPNGGNSAELWYYDGRSVVDADIANAYAILDVVALGDGDAIATGTAVGGIGTTWRREGGTWTEVVSDGYQELEAAAGDDMLARSTMTLHQFDGTAFRSPFPMPLDHPLNSEQLVGVLGLSTGEAVVVASDAVFLRTTTGFVGVTTPPLGFRTLRGLFGRAGTDAFVFGDDGLVLRGDGHSFVEYAIPANEFAGDVISGDVLAATAVFVGTSSGKVYTFDGATFTEVASMIDPVVGVHAVAANDVWALDARGDVAHFDGNQWSNTSLGGASNLTAVALTGAGNRLFALTTDTLYVGDGSSWTPLPVTTPAPLTALTARSANDVVVVAASGHAYRYDGLAISDISSDAAWAMRSITPIAGGVLVVGDLGMVLRRAM